MADWRAGKNQGLCQSAIVLTRHAGSQTARAVGVHGPVGLPQPQSSSAAQRMIPALAFASPRTLPVRGGAFLETR